MKKLFISLLTLLSVIGASAQWFQQSSGTANYLLSVCFINAQSGVAVGDSGTVLRTADGGEHWEKVISGTSETLFSVSFPNDTIGYVAGHTANAPTILKTIDGGASWFSSSTGVQWGLQSIYFTDADNGYAAGGGGGLGWDDNGSVYKTTNGGATWTKTFTRGFYCFNAYFTSPDTGFVLTYLLNPNGYGTKYEISKTNDGGVSWNNYLIGNVNETYVRSLCFPDRNTGYAACEKGSIYKTSDGGITWEKLDVITDKTLNSVFFTDLNTGYVVGDSIILKTTDGGANWTIQDMGASGQLFSVFFQSADIGWAAGQNGLIVKTTNGGLNAVNENAVLSSHLTLYPSPAHEKIIVETLVTDDTQLSIININGQQIIERKITEFKTEINISNLPPGIYFVKIRNKNSLEVRKLLKE